MTYGGAYGGYPGVGTVASYPAVSGFGGFGYGAGVPFAGVPAIDPTRVMEMKEAQLGQVNGYSEAVKQQIATTTDHQLAMIDRQSEHEIALVVGQINQRREAQKMQVQQQSQAQLLTVDQRRMTQSSALEQQAMQAQAQAQQYEIMRASF